MNVHTVRYTRIYGKWPTKTTQIIPDPLWAMHDAGARVLPETPRSWDVGHSPENSPGAAVSLLEPISKKQTCYHQESWPIMACRDNPKMHKRPFSDAQSVQNIGGKASTSISLRSHDCFLTLSNIILYERIWLMLWVATTCYNQFYIPMKYSHKIAWHDWSLIELRDDSQNPMKLAKHLSCLPSGHQLRGWKHPPDQSFSQLSTSISFQFFWLNPPKKNTIFLG